MGVCRNKTYNNNSYYGFYFCSFVWRLVKLDKKPKKRHFAATHISTFVWRKFFTCVCHTQDRCEVFFTLVWHLLDRSADGGWISLGFIIILMNYWSIGGIFNFILLKIWILHNKVVTSKKKLTWSPPISHFIHFLGYHLQDQPLFQEKKIDRGSPR